ncbi:hypothetical protein [Acinetobacter indicus]|uniref:hypothetical protein n=1 Tax=Acinetobacter indicus TaxID=756892 RepID=UPI0012E1662D|nr:hypothetical protein [Acinetobacter indicus]
MATRKVQTPGAKPADTTIETPVDEAPAIGSVGETPEEQQDQSTNETSSLGAPVEDERLDQILENQKRIEGKLDQLLKAGGIEAPKKKRWVQGKNGYEQKEV